MSDTAKLPVIHHWIAGAPSAGVSTRRGSVFNPASGLEVRETLLAETVDVDAAVAAAKAAQPAWAAYSAQRRSRVLFRLRELLERDAQLIAGLISDEHGKTLPDAMGEVQRGLEVVEFSCGAPQLLKGEHSHGIGGGIDHWAQRMPLGVVAGITPFNFPFMVPMWMAPVAIACGNAFILKPSERDPSPSLHIAALFEEAGLPAGIFSVVQGDRIAVDRLLEHPDVQAVSFVGSTPIARHVYESAARHGKRAQALGGAKNHLVVLPDADLDQAADGLIGAAYGSAGERCMAISVAVLVGDIADAVVARVVARAAALRIGAGNTEGVDMGPLVTAAHRARVIEFIDSGIAEGAQLVLDGRQGLPRECDAGFFVGPTLFDHVAPSMRIYQEEIFGPVLSVVRVASLREAVDLVNAHPFGNGVSLYTRDGGAAQAFCREIQAGMVGINVPIPVPLAWHSFGGWKQSLFGDHHSYGEEGVRFYTRYKSIMQRWPDGSGRGPEFVMPVNG
jgi:malonate-semialdehyde dehydrogenase (acetylating)/methylmalonate-semialdehyde dehydrogenase